MQFDEVTSFLLEIQKSVSDLSDFQQITELVTFQPFSSGREALEYMNNSSEGNIIDYSFNICSVAKSLTGNVFGN